MNEASLKSIYNKTSGHCHFCGDPIKFVHRGWSETPDGHWEVDHVIQRDKGSAKSSENCLPACTRCNRRRWHRTGDSLRELLLLGVIAAREIKEGTQIGQTLEYLKRVRLERNVLRRTRKTAKIT